MRRLLYLVPLAAFVVVAAWFAYGLTRDPSRLPSALLDRPVPEFQLASLSGIDSPGFHSGDLRGKVAMVNVFASWCVPCRAEHPQLMALEAAGVEIVGVAYKDRAENAAQFLAELGDPFAAVGLDPDGRFGLDLGLVGVPETFVIGADGTVRAVHRGPLTAQIVENEILPALEAGGRQAD